MPVLDRTRRWALPLLLLSASAAVSPWLSACRIYAVDLPCKVDDHCPSPQTCADGICRTVDGGSASDEDATSVDGSSEDGGAEDGGAEDGNTGDGSAQDAGAADT